MDHTLAVMRGGKIVEPRDGAQILAKTRLLELRIGACRRSSAAKCVCALIRPERRPRQRAPIGQHGNSVLLAIRQDIVLNGTLEEVIGRLSGMERSHGPERLHLRRRAIADADGAYLS